MTTEFTSAKSVILKRGNRGRAVRVLETGLGFRTRDRVFDADTEAAVRAFQKSEHLTVTGIVNRATWDALERRAHPFVDYWKTVLRPGATGPAVVAVQTALGVPADGVYGDSTVAAVKAFQGRYHLARTGYVAILTWRALDAAQTSVKVEIGSVPRASAQLADAPVSATP